MKAFREWAVIGVIAAVLLVAKSQFLARGYYNWFLLLVLGLVVAAVFCFKAWHEPQDSEGEAAKDSR